MIITICQKCGRPTPCLCEGFTWQMTVYTPDKDLEDRIVALEKEVERLTKIVELSRIVGI